MSGITAEEVDQIISDSMGQLNKVIAQAQSEMNDTVSGFEQKQSKTIQTLTDLVQTLQTAQKGQVNIDPNIQKNMMACVRGECRRLQMNIGELKREQARQSQFIDAIPQQLHNQIAEALPLQPEQEMFKCEVCGSQFPAGVTNCPGCGVVIEWN